MKNKISGKAAELIAIKQAKGIISALKKGGRFDLATKLNDALNSDLERLKNKNKGVCDELQNANNEE